MALTTFPYPSCCGAQIIINPPIPYACDEKKFEETFIKDLMAVVPKVGLTLIELNNTTRVLAPYLKKVGFIQVSGSSNCTIGTGLQNTFLFVYQHRKIEIKL